MKLSQMEKQLSDSVRPVVLQTVQLLEPYKERGITPGLWRSLMLLLFGVVSPASKEAAEVARRFYDEERERVFPGIPRHDFFLPELEFERFLEDMDEVFELFRGGAAPDHAPHSAGLRAARTIENSARLTVIKAVSEDDPFFDDAVSFVESDDFVVEESSGGKPKKERSKDLGRRWARVATGAETCGWCLMLCSRGAVYASSKSAGELHQWHTGCDCKVVPVFDPDNWEGMERYAAAERMWIEASRNHSGRDAVRQMEKLASSGRFQEILNN